MELAYKNVLPRTLSDSDQKLEKILSTYASGRLQKPAASRQLHLKFMVWSLRNRINQSLKRCLDLTLAFFAVIGTAPLFIITALAIKLESPGPVIFKQERVGKWGKRFTCYKFRSMRIDAEEIKQSLAAQNEADGPIFKMQDDPRVTRVGRIIRKLSIDELPQFFNILKGDMSFVGPRPPLPKEVYEYELEQLRRLDTVPGLTGLQQVSGRSDLTFERWVELDLEYISKQSVQLDIIILLKTIPTVLMGKGAY